MFTELIVSKVVRPSQPQMLVMDRTHWKWGRTDLYPNTTLYNGLTLNLVCHRPTRGELKQVLALYGQRWTIETTFACLKSRGFNLEDTHMPHPQRIQLLIGLLAWTLLWALLMGEQLLQRKPIPLKKHGRKAISLFRRGLDQLTQIIHQPRDQPNIARQYQPMLLSCT